MVSAFEKYVTGNDATLEFTNTAWIATTFTIGHVGDNVNFNVSSVDIALDDLRDDICTAGIYNVKPDGSPDIAAGAISTGTFTTTTTTPAWINITMSLGTLKASTMYALVLSASDATGLDWKYDANGGLTYTEGDLWTSADSGASWANQSPALPLFQINGGDYAGTLCTLADARNKAGANAAAGAVNESIASDYVRQAEGTINAVTRFNWVDAYTSLTDDVKFILNDVASNLAAIYMITYDMSGFTDRVEAETMINVYRDAALRGLGILKNQAVKTFIVGDT